MITVSDLRPGDIMLYRPKGVIGWLIASRTWSNWAHVEVYIGGGWAAASRDGVGVGRYLVRWAQLGRVLRPVQPVDIETGLRWFDAVADGNQIKHSKPAPDVFLLAAELLNMPSVQCLVVEDADSGVEAALAAGMKVLGVGSASSNQKAHLRAGTLAEINLVSEIRKFV